MMKKEKGKGKGKEEEERNLASSNRQIRQWIEEDQDRDLGHLCFSAYIQVRADFKVQHESQTLIQRLLVMSHPRTRILG